ncbi:hypothetical protein [Flagellimonas allohymeniacidonis]|uniref:Uncharacterized protein n=1 Tax=Flagellimonas allohymeniacidonis TaxID=2517819 RepID=A0A4Q8QD66_9FLAO|nr:hypothetical protein [Allomuricauda hymeniacidonis]TAI47634.1 hypothetical protein EW142_13300 [Allomuricauda hymeniacidonis]
MLGLFPCFVGNNGLGKKEKEKFKEIPVDVRVVVIDRNHNDADIDLWVVDPTNEKKETIIVRLDQEEDVMEFGTLKQNNLFRFAVAGLLWSRSVAI